jgi:polyisoprenoid-binding protein YceI
LKHFIPFVLAAALPFSALAADTYVLDPSHTFPSFEVSHLGFSVHRGRFNRTSGKAVLDLPAKGGSIEVVIDVASVDTGGEKLEAHLKAEDFFNAEKYPTMTFTSDKLRFEGDNLVGADGFLPCAVLPGRSASRCRTSSAARIPTARRLCAARTSRRPSSAPTST